MELVRDIGNIYINGMDTKYGIFFCQTCKKEVLTSYDKGMNTVACCGRGNGKVSTNPIYWVWASFKGRCTNPKNERWDRYGGRGISVCNEWINSYKNFKEWALKNGYKKELQIDRIDNDGNYSPENCRFVTIAENSRNRASTKLNWDKVDLLRKLYSSGDYTYKDLGMVFGVESSQIGRIVNNKSWVKA